MDWFTALVVFVLVWWTLLFAILPLWTRPKSDADETTGWRGLPEKPLIGRKLLLTTVVSVVVWGAIMLVVRSDSWSFRASL